MRGPEVINCSAGSFAALLFFVVVTAEEKVHSNTFTFHGLSEPTIVLFRQVGTLRSQKILDGTFAAYSRPSLRQRLKFQWR